MKNSYKPLILCIDDDGIALSVLLRILEGGSYRAASAKNGYEAFQQISENRPDLVLLDVKMPEMDGYEVCSRLKANRELEGIPVIFVTGLEKKEDRERAISVGAVDFLVKPVPRDLLLQKVRSHLETNTRSQETSGRTVAKEQRTLLSDFIHFKDFLAEKVNLTSDGQQKLSAATPNGIYEFCSTVGMVSNQLARLMAEFLKVSYLPLINPQDVHLGSLQAPFCRANLVTAIRKGRDRQTFVLSNPFNWDVLSVLNKFSALDQTSQFSITEPDNILGLFEEEQILNRELLVSSAPSSGGKRPLGRAPARTHDSSLEGLSELQVSDRMLELAVTERASDIHVEPKATHTAIRFRVDGDMQEAFTLNKEVSPRLISRFKALGSMNIAERRRPQDGSCEITISQRKFKLRLATTSTADGESLIIRLLEPEAKLNNLQELGMTDAQMKMMNGFANRSQGLVLVVGPTGSGKTTTIYSFLAHIDCQTRSLISVEDPVEYRIPFANQQQVNEKIGVSFDSLLRSVVRQDPDILFLGEVRDALSAKNAMDFASTGHLTLSTLHTANATTAIFRLERLEVSRGIMVDSLIGVVAQRLIKKLCSDCKKTDPITKEEAEMLSPFTREIPEQLAQPVGCPQCNQTGYRGREGIYEIIGFDPDVSQLIRSGAPIGEIREFVRNRGDTLISHHAVEKVSKLLFPLKDIYEKVLVEEVQFHQDTGGQSSQKDLPVQDGVGRRTTPSKLRLVHDAQSKSLATHPLPQPSILVVEDDRVSRSVIRRILESSGAKVSVAEDGVDSLLQLGGDNFDLVVSDIHMPNLDGFKLLEMMTQKGMGIPVIFVTGDSTDEQEIKGLELGAASYIKKPIQKDLLLAQVKMVLEKASKRAAKMA